MMNIEQITSRLAKLPDQQLQQYAMMHKSDPYIMALAVSESNRRKEMRAAIQGAQGMQEQPKVADMALAAMAPQQSPDDAGIAQLPAGNMDFADGGIVAFADGGGVERYQSGGTPYESPYDRMNRLNRERVAAERAERLARIEAAGGNTTPYSEQMGNVGRFIDQYVPDPIDLFKTVIQAPGYGWGREARSATPTSLPTGQTQPTPQQIEAASQPKPAPKPPSAGLGGTKEAAALQGARVPGTTPAATTAPAAAGTPAAPGYANLNVEQMYKDALAKASAEPDPLAEERKTLGQERVKAKEEEATGLEAIQNQFNNIFSGRKERLATKEAEIAKMGNQSLGLSLLQAGAAMMSTPGGIGAAVGKGIDVGSKQYIAGLDRLNSAKDKLSDARDRLEEIEAQRGELSARELFKARNEVKNVGISVRDDLIKAKMDMNKVNRETATKMVDSQLAVAKTVYEQTETTGRTKLQTEATLAAAATRASGKGELTPNQRAEIANKAMDNVTASLKSNVPLQIKAAKDPAYLQQLVQSETARLMAAAEGRTMAPAPGAPSPGGTSLKYNPKTGKIE